MTGTCLSTYRSDVGGVVLECPVRLDDVLSDCWFLCSGNCGVMSNFYSINRSCQHGREE